MTPPLPKHLRPRYRYLAVTAEAWADVSIDRDAVQAAVVTGVRGLFGDAGVAAADPRVMRFRWSGGAGQFVLRTRRNAVSPARAGLATLGSVEGEPVAVCVRGISGTVRGCEEKYLNGRQLRSAESTVAFEDADRPATVRGNRVDVHLEDAFAGAMDLDLT